MCAQTKPGSSNSIHSQTNEMCENDNSIYLSRNKNSCFSFIRSLLTFLMRTENTEVKTTCKQKLTHGLETGSTKRRRIKIRRKIHRIHRSRQSVMPL